MEESGQLHTLLPSKEPQELLVKRLDGLHNQPGDYGEEKISYIFRK
jgi:hypothetical protein